MPLCGGRFVRDLVHGCELLEESLGGELVGSLMNWFIFLFNSFQFPLSITVSVNSDNSTPSPLIYHPSTCLSTPRGNLPAASW